MNMNIKNMVRDFLWRNQVTIIVIGVLIVFTVIFEFAYGYERSVCVESGGRWNHGLIAGRYSAWCEGGR